MLSEATLLSSYLLYNSVKVWSIAGGVGGRGSGLYSTGGCYYFLCNFPTPNSLAAQLNNGLHHEDNYLWCYGVSI